MPNTYRIPGKKHSWHKYFKNKKSNKCDSKSEAKRATVCAWEGLGISVGTTASNVIGIAIAKMEKDPAKYSRSDCGRK